jgi:hypothetical protein
LCLDASRRQIGACSPEHIPGARYIELPGDDHLTIREGDHGVFDDLEEFLTGTRPEPEIDRVLKTVPFRTS